jgi:hypothetical protein
LKLLYNPPKDLGFYAIGQSREIRLSLSAAPGIFTLIALDIDNMRKIEIVAVAQARTASEVFPLIADFERYQNQCSAVRSVTFTERGEDRSVSKWALDGNRRLRPG